jgi:hypothetical protein
MKTSKDREHEKQSETECSMGISENRRADRARVVATQIEARGIHDSYFEGMARLGSRPLALGRLLGDAAAIPFASKSDSAL